MKFFLRIVVLSLFSLVAICTHAEAVYKVTARSLNVRQAPSTQSAITTKLYRGELVRVETISDNWAYVYAENGKEGWVAKKHIEFKYSQIASSQTNVAKQKKGQEKVRFDKYMLKNLQSFSDTFCTFAIVLSILGWLVAGLDERGRYTWLGVVFYICATLCSVLFFLSSPNMNLTGFFNYLLFGVSLCVILLGQLATFREMSIRLLWRSDVEISGLLFLSFIALSIGGLITAICMWFDYDFYIGLAVVLGIAILIAALYIGTDALEFKRFEYTIPGAFFYLYGCIVSYFLISISIVITIPLAILMCFGYALGSGDSSSSGSASTGTRRSGDDFSWTGYIPNFHKGPTGNVGWDDDGNTYTKGPNGEWHKDR